MMDTKHYVVLSQGISYPHSVFFTGYLFSLLRTYYAEHSLYPRCCWRCWGTEQWTGEQHSGSHLVFPFRASHLGSGIQEEDAPAGICPPLAEFLCSSPCLVSPIISALQQICLWVSVPSVCPDCLSLCLCSFHLLVCLPCRSVLLFVLLPSLSGDLFLDCHSVFSVP